MVEISEEARARIRAEVEETKRRAEARARDETPPPRAGAKKSPGASRPATFSQGERDRRRQAASRYDHGEIVKLYDRGNGLSSHQIAEKLGANRMTIVKALRKAGVWDPRNEGKGGRPLSEYCESGQHLMKNHREERPPGSGKFQCSACRRKRDNKYKQKSREKFRTNELRPVEGMADVYQVVIEGKEVGRAHMEEVTAKALDEKLKKMSRRRGVKL